MGDGDVEYQAADIEHVNAGDTNMRTAKRFLQNPAPQPCGAVQQFQLESEIPSAVRSSLKADEFFGPGPKVLDAWLYFASKVSIFFCHAPSGTPTGPSLVE